MRYAAVVCLALTVAAPATAQLVWEQKADCPHPVGYGSAIAFAPNVGKLYAMRELPFEIYEDLDYYYPPSDAWGSVYNNRYERGTGYGASIAYCPDGNVYFVSGGNQRFSGGIETIYASLVVRLSYTDYFRREDQWKYAVEFSRNGSRLGFSMQQVEEGTGELVEVFSSRTNRPQCE